MALRNLLVRRWKGMFAYLAAGLAGALVASLLLAALDRKILGGFVTHLDAATQAWVHGHASTALTPWMELLTHIGGPIFATSLCLMITAAEWRWHQRRGAMLLVTAMAGGALLDTALKLHFHRTRPDVPWSLVHEHSYSFPSGHSVEACVMYGTLLYLHLRRLHAAWTRTLACLGALTLATGIGYSRVYLGAHWPSDVLAGYACGLIWLGSLVGADLLVRRELPREVLVALGR